VTLSKNSQNACKLYFGALRMPNKISVKKYRKTTACVLSRFWLASIVISTLYTHWFPERTT